MSHRSPHPEMPVKPKASGHRVDHAVASAFELLPLSQEGKTCARYWQPMSPSTVAGGSAGTLPK